MNAYLHLVGPINFNLSSNAVRRAGLDYWDELNLTIHESPQKFIKWLGNREPWLVTKHGKLRFDSPEYGDEDILVFGSETRGIPQEWHVRWPERAIYIPILGNVRSYNLANTVSVVLAQASIAADIFGMIQERGRLKK